MPILLLPTVLLSTNIIVDNIIVNSIVNIDNITSIKWSIMGRVYGKTKTDRCPSCLAEILHLIEYFDDIWLLNKRSEFINHCRHQNNLLLKSLKRNDSMD